MTVIVRGILRSLTTVVNALPNLHDAQQSSLIHMTADKSVITREIVDFAREHFALAWEGIHGAPHWGRVLHNGMLIADHTGADTKIVQYFAFIHDLDRHMDGSDPLHGPRGADLAINLADVNIIDVTDDQLRLLTNAIYFHSDGYTDGDPTIITCWDADRLDLGRVGIYPDANRLCTAYAKQPEVIEAAYQRSLHNV